jgi:hypothetical protein
MASQKNSEKGKNEVNQGRFKTKRAKQRRIKKSQEDNGAIDRL